MSFPRWGWLPAPPVWVKFYVLRGFSPAGGAALLLLLPLLQLTQPGCRMELVPCPHPPPPPPACPWGERGGPLGGGAWPPPPPPLRGCHWL